jgi:ABC-type lipoprotein export system ATPase subunit
MQPAQAEADKNCLIRCVRLERLYTDGRVAALREVDLSIGRGEYIAVMGPSGSGKSTLLNLIGGLDRPTAGDVFFDGLSLSAPGHMDRLRIDKIGFVFQAFHLLPTLSACENVQIPMFEGPLGAAARRRRAAALLGEVGMSHRLDHLPTQLSGGERQRVAIARALANDPMVLLADEPTGNLDTATGEEILKLFARMHQERRLTILLVTHSQEIAEQAQRLIRLRDGRVIEDRVLSGRTKLPAR